MRKKLGWFILTVALILALPLWAAAQGKGKGKDKGKPAEHGQKAEHEAEEAAQGRAFGHDQERVIREWFSNEQNLEGLPPGLAKREELPPGLQRHLEKNGTLPPGLQKRIQPLPQNLESRLPKLPEGVKRVVVAGSVILLEERTSRIVDIVQDVFGWGSSRESPTGVRRNP
ncbi:MAG: hypothetical protein V3U28_08085 [Candidatus Acidoferrales bacterium]